MLNRMIKSVGKTIRNEKIKSHNAAKVIVLFLQINLFPARLQNEVKGPAKRLGKAGSRILLTGSRISTAVPCHFTANKGIAHNRKIAETKQGKTNDSKNNWAINGKLIVEVAGTAPQ